MPTKPSTVQDLSTFLQALAWMFPPSDDGFTWDPPDLARA